MYLYRIPTVSIHYVQDIPSLACAAAVARAPSPARLAGSLGGGGTRSVSLHKRYYRSAARESGWNGVPAAS